MAAVAATNPVSLPSGLGARETFDLADPVLDLQKIDAPQVSLAACAQRFGAQAIRSLFEKMDERGVKPVYEDINLADNCIGDDGAEYLAKGLLACPSLKRLTMPRAGVGAKGFKAMGELVAKAPKLESLVMSSNTCDSAGMEGPFSEGLAKNKSLRSLVLATCRIGDEGVDALAPALKSHPTLEHVCLTYNRLEAACVKSINEVLATNKALRYLDLCGNSLGPEGAELLVEGLKANKGRIQQLGVAQNGLRAKGVTALCKYFMAPEGKSLVYLDLRHNYVTYKAFAPLRNGLLGKPMDGPEGWMLLYGERQLLVNAH